MINNINTFNEHVPAKMPDRRIILAAAVILLASLGSVYSWSFFTRPLIEAYKWNNMQVSIVFSLAVAGLGFSALVTGPKVSKKGGRYFMKLATKLFVLGYVVAALGLYLGSGVIGSIETPWVNWLSYIILALGYGVIGGIGLGVGYVSAVTTVAAWFPDKKGFATGFIVMGFGLGAIFMSKVFAPVSMDLTSDNIPLTFLIIAGIYAIIMFTACKYIYSPQFAQVASKKPTLAETIEHPNHVRVKLWVTVFLYSFAGLGIISLLSPLMQNLLGANDSTLSKEELAIGGATLIVSAAIGNSVGRLFWAWLSDIMGRVNTFVVLLGSSAIIFFILPNIASPLLFGVLIAYTVASYGGGFGTVPSLISDLYGPKRMSAVHGLVLSGWAVSGLISPFLFGYLYDVIPNEAANYVYYICASVMVVGTLLMTTFYSLHKKCTMPLEVRIDSDVNQEVKELVSQSAK